MAALLLVCAGVAGTALRGFGADLSDIAFVSGRGASVFRLRSREQPSSASHVIRWQGQQQGRAPPTWIGVTRHPKTGEWQAHVPDPEGGEPVTLGLFPSAGDAAKAYDRAILGVRGEDAETNFPSDLYFPEDVQEEVERMKDLWRRLPSARYYGVYRTKESPLWKAELELYRRHQFLDYHETELGAAKAVDQAIRDSQDWRAEQLKRLNFIEDTDYFDEETWEMEVVPRGLSSRFLGVTYHQPTDKFLARTGRKHVGLFDTEYEAARGFDAASLARGGLTNFRPPSED